MKAVPHRRYWPPSKTTCCVDRLRLPPKGNNSKGLLPLAGIVLPGGKRFKQSHPYAVILHRQEYIHQTL